MTWTSSWTRDAARSHAQLDEAGYAFDYISDDQIAKTRTAGGALVTPGNTYDVLVVPRADRMPLATLRKLAELARDGATIVFDGLPSDVPGYGNLAQRRSEFRAVLDGWRFSAGPVAAVERAASGSGRLLRGDVLAALESIGTVREAFADTPIDFIRRRTAVGLRLLSREPDGRGICGLGHAGRGRGGRRRSPTRSPAGRAPRCCEHPDAARVRASICS